ncbi:MAG TPA: HAMP domain-containing sensor histidine kinase [Acidimicrobiia bacterium]|nr:HAMP domain-containing sensor histidine kinase [Acidimicrobiia bacterium]
MASRAATALLASSYERLHLHRIVVRVGALAAWIATAIYLIVGAVSSSVMYIEAIGPFLAAALMTYQIIAGREDGGLALFGSGVVVVVWYMTFGDDGGAVPAAVSLVLIAALGMLFVSRQRFLTTIALAGVLFGVPFLWDITTQRQVILGSIMAVSFVTTHFILSAVQTASQALSARYQLLFENSPTAVLEEDWSEALEYLRSEYTGNPQRIKQFLLAFPDVVRDAVSQSRTLRANEATMRLLEVRSAARFLGYRRPELVTDETMDAFVNALVCLYEGGKTWEEEILTHRRSGDLMWLQIRAVDASTGAPASSILIALADVTHIKARSEAMAEMVRAKDEFIANISHELRTPLTAVMGLTSEMVESSGIGAEERAELLRLVASQASEMANIVDDLLVAARADMGTVSLDIQEMELLAELRATIEGIGIAIEVPTNSVPSVLADPKRVRQILRNLLTNAQRYGGPECRITIGSLLNRVWLEVRDNGPGIPENMASHIFEPYVTGTTNVTGSVGLGLAVSRQLAELMGGSLQYERSAGESVFRLLLPKAPEMEPLMATRSDR